VDVESNGLAYTSIARLPFLLWCLRLAARDDVQTGDDLLLVVLVGGGPVTPRLRRCKVEWGAIGDGHDVASDRTW